MHNNSMLWLFQLKFWILIVLSIPSAVCSVLILIHFYRQRHAIATYQHLIIGLLTISLFQIVADMTSVMAYYHRRQVIPASSSFCTWWTWAEYTSNGILVWLMAWGSIERHLLIFHRSIMNTQRKRLVFHIFPMLIVSLYPSLFYFSVLVLNSCQNQWDYEMVLCGIPCFATDYPSQASFDFIFNIVFPIATIAAANLCLIVRVIRQKRRHHLTWRRQRKLTVQLVTIAILYVVFWLPLTINGLIVAYSAASLAVQIQVDYFFFLLYMVPLLLPFVSLSHLPDLVGSILRRRRRAVQPLNKRD